MAGPHMTSSGPSAHNSGQDARRPNKKPEGGFKRKRTGCMTCRQRKIGCDERKPQCLNCEKSKRQCSWEGGSIWKHDQNPSVRDKKDSKFYKKAPTAFEQEDERRLAAGTPRGEYQFVNSFGDSGASVHSPPVTNATGAAVNPNAHYQQLDPRNLQALASAATYQNSHLPPVQWVDADRQGDRGQTFFHTSSTTPNAVIDPNLDDGAGNVVRSETDQTTEHGTENVEREEDVDARLAQVLKAAETQEGPT